MPAELLGAVESHTLAPGEPNPYAHWQRNLLFIWIGVFTALLGANFVFPFVPFYLKDLGVEGKSAIGYWSSISASATGFSLTVTAPLWGSLGDRFGRRAMFLRAIVGAAIVIAIMGLVQTPLQFIAMRFVLGAFAGTVGAAAALVAVTAPREKLGYAMGALQTAQFSSNMLGPFIGGIVSAAIGIRPSFFFCAALYAIAIIPVWIFVREPRIIRQPEGETATMKRRGGIFADFRLVVSERQVLLMLGLLFMLGMATQYIRPVLPLSIDGFSDGAGAVSSSDSHVPFDLGAVHFTFDEKLATGVVFGAIGMTSTLAALAVAPLAARFGYRNCIAGAALATGILFLPVAASGSYTSFLIWMAAVGLFQGAMIPGTNALIAVGAPDGKQGAAFGLAASCTSLASLVGPLAGGGVNGVFGTPTVYGTMGIMLIGGSIAAYLLIREPAVLQRVSRAHDAD